MGLTATQIKTREGRRVSLFASFLFPIDGVVTQRRANSLWGSGELEIQTKRSGQTGEWGEYTSFIKGVPIKTGLSQQGLIVTGIFSTSQFYLFQFLYSNYFSSESSNCTDWANRARGFLNFHVSKWEIGDLLRNWNAFGFGFSYINLLSNIFWTKYLYVRPGALGCRNVLIFRSYHPNS